MNESPEPREPDVVDRVLRSFDHVLDIVHDRVLRPILIAGRTVAFGFVLILVALVLVTVLVVGLVRLLNVYLFAGHEWISYAILGALFVSVGLIIWRRRNRVNLRK